MQHCRNFGVVAFKVAVVSICVAVLAGVSKVFCAPETEAHLNGRVTKISAHSKMFVEIDEILVGRAESIVRPADLFVKERGCWTKCAAASED